LLHSKNAPKRITLEAVVIRADGSREDLGIIADTKTKKGFIETVKRMVSK
jgi:hypothetical protein